MSDVKSSFRLTSPDDVTATLEMTMSVGYFRHALRQIQDGELERYEARLVLGAIRSIVEKATSGEWEFYEPEPQP